MYSWLVPSLRIAALAMSRSPPETFRSMPPLVPTRINVSAPHITSSSTAIAAEGPPIPVEHTLTFSPSRYPVYTVYSRVLAISFAPSSFPAIFGTRPGSPGSITYLPMSPFLVFRWKQTSPETMLSMICSFQLVVVSCRRPRRRVSTEPSPAPLSPASPPTSGY